jgi:flagellar biosynthesis protein FlhA
LSDIAGSIRKILLSDKSEALVAVGVIVIVMMMIIPLPAWLLDFFMIFNLGLSLLIILIVLYTRRVLDFSVFPTLLLVSTVFGLALNISSTRLILSRGAAFNGQMVRAFGSFVVGAGGTEGMVIGLIIFIIIIAVQFVVITKGATRVAEVAARFTLDSLPVKQMAIEQEYSSGAITEEESRQRKRDLQKESDFYGSMDGASKFISGNVKVGIFITLINMVGGFIVGVTIHGESASSAISNYISLTIGDGLITQFPSLLVSTATGLIVTRAVSDGTFGRDISEQFTRDSRIYWIAAIFLFLLAFVPGFPWYLLGPLGILVGFSAYLLSRKKQAAVQTEKEKTKSAAVSASPELSPVAPPDPISLELGYGLIPLVDKDQSSELLDRITRIRRETALELGLVVPRIRIIDNMRLEAVQYCIKIRNVEMGTGIIRMGHYLAINPGGLADEIPGEKTTDPAFGLPAKWITEEYRDRAERAGFTIVDNQSVIATHLTEVIKSHAHELLGRVEMQRILDALKSDYASVVDEVLKTLSLGEVLKIMQRLLQEQVSIRNIVTILEAVADYAPVSRDTTFLVEKVRQVLSREICLALADENKVLHVWTLNPALEQEIIDSRVDTAAGPVAALAPELQRRWLNLAANMIRAGQNQGYTGLILTSEPARVLVRNAIRRELPETAVISVPEIDPAFKVERLGEINPEQTAPVEEETAAAGGRR